MSEQEGLIEHPQQPGVFYDPSIVYIHTGDPLKDAGYRVLRSAHDYSIPQTWIIGATDE